MLAGPPSRPARGGTDTVAQQGAGQTEISDVVLAGGSADSHNVADVLNHGSNGNSQTGNDSISIELGQMEVGKTNPCSSADTIEGNSAHDDGNDVGNDQGDQNGDDLDHALAPGIADDDHEDRNNTESPVGQQVVNSRASKVNTDEDDQRAANNRRGTAS